MSAIENGLSVAALDCLADAIPPNDETFQSLIVPRPTLMRRRKDSAYRLTSEESGRLTRLAKVWAFAVEVWGSESEARDVLHRPHPMLARMERNILITLAHPDAAAITRDLPTPVWWDRRLFGAPGS